MFAAFSMLRNSLPEQFFVGVDQRGEHSFRFPSARANENFAASRDIFTFSRNE